MPGRAPSEVLEWPFYHLRCVAPVRVRNVTVEESKEIGLEARTCLGSRTVHHHGKDPALCVGTGRIANVEGQATIRQHVWHAG